MIVKRNLSPVRVAQYTAGPMLWAGAWAVAVPVVHELTGEDRMVLPFAPVATLAAALAIFVAFRNNASFARWNEARSAWQSILVASRVLGRQLASSTGNAVAAGTVEAAEASAYTRECLLRLSAFAYALGARTRPGFDDTRLLTLLPAPELAPLREASNAPNLLLATEGHRIKEGIRRGLLGQFDPIALEPQLAALNSAQGVIERIKNTPTPRQYEYFTRRFIQIFAALAPFGLLSLVPGMTWWVVPLALILSGVFIVMATVGSANDEPFENRVTDVPILAICVEIERDLRELLGDTALPPPVAAADGYLW
jgi:putative membrane protein